MEDRAGIRLLLIHFCLRHKVYSLLRRAVCLGAGAQQQAKKAPLPPREGNMNIYVGNLSLEVTDEELQRESMAFGVHWETAKCLCCGGRIRAEKVYHKVITTARYRSLSFFRSPHHDGCTFKQGFCFYQRDSVFTPYCGEAINRTPLTEVRDTRT